MMGLALHPDTEDEHYAAAYYYARESAALAERYLHCVENAIARIAENPLQFALFHGEVRRLVLQDFPYSVFYTVEPERVFIIAIMHSRRKPGYWRERLNFH